MYHLPTTPISTRHAGQVEQKQLNKAPEPQHGSHVLPLHSGFFQRSHINSHFRHGFCHHAYCTKSLGLDLFFFSEHDTPWPLGPWQHTARCYGLGCLQGSSLQFSMLFCSSAAYGGYPCFTHLLMYYRGMRNGIHFGRARALTWTLESMEDASGAFACISANALLFTSNTLQQLPLAEYRVAYEKHDDTLRVTFIPPHSSSHVLPCATHLSHHDVRACNNALAYSFCTTCLSNPQIPLSIARVSSFL